MPTKRMPARPPSVLPARRRATRASRGPLSALALTAWALSGCSDPGEGSGLRYATSVPVAQIEAPSVPALGTAVPGAGAVHAARPESVSPEPFGPEAAEPQTLGPEPYEVVFRSPVSPWGVAPSAALSQGPGGWIDEMVAAGVTAVRGFRAASDGELHGALLHAGTDLTGTLAWTPTGEPEPTLPVSDLDGWRAYVADQIVRHGYAVSRWEIWNEPPNFTADKSPESYARVVAAAYDVAKAIDPDVRIGIAAKSTHLHYLGAAMDAGAAGHFDFVTLHPYEAAGQLRRGTEGSFLRIAENVRAMLADKSPDQKDAPIHFTEIGLQVDDGGNGGVTPGVQADGLVMIYTLGYAQGIDRIHWFDPRDSELLEHGLLDGTGSARPAYHALRALTTWMGERPAYHGRISSETGLHGHVFSGPHGTVLSAWAEIGAAASLSFDSDVRVVDPHDGSVVPRRNLEIGREPVLVVAPTGSPAERRIHAEIRAEAARRDEAGSADEVWLEAGERSRGIVLADDHALVRRGGVATIDVPSAGPYLLFAVDADFVGWTPEPVEVTAVVRGHGVGNPGFNLKYEAARHPARTDGWNMVSASEGWRTVSGTEPTTFTWVLDDPRFVGKYGAHLRLDSDSRAHADWSLLRLSVRRLDGSDRAR